MNLKNSKDKNIMLDIQKWINTFKKNENGLNVTYL